MRITGGRARGIPLQAPAGQGTRPAMDRLREAVFSRLGPSVAGLVVLDLFAGSGAYGLEALSRGAARALFIERDRRALTCLRMNLTAVARSLGQPADELGKIRAVDLRRWEPAPEERFGLIFADPPYAEAPDWFQALLPCLPAWADEDRRLQVLFELPGPAAPELPPGWFLLRYWPGGGPGSPGAALLEMV